MKRVPQAVRKRLTPQNILSTLPILAVLSYINGSDTEAMVIGLAGFALDRLQRMGIVTKHAKTYSIDESGSGFSGLLRKVVSRITRPLTISA